MTNWKWGTMTLALGALAVGCGDDGDGGGLAGGSYDAVLGAIEMPSGTVDETTTEDVALAVDAALSSDTPDVGGFSMLSDAVQKQSIGAAYCSSGDINIEAASENGATIHYADCCIEGCCIAGRQSVYSSAGGEYTSCTSFNLTTTCSGEEAVTTNYNHCLSPEGNLVYAIEIESGTYAVSVEGSYSSGTGTLEIRGENGTFTCTMTDYSGSCEGEGTTFDF